MANNRARVLVLELQVRRGHCRVLVGWRAENTLALVLLQEGVKLVLGLLLRDVGQGIVRLENAVEERGRGRS